MSLLEKYWFHTVNFCNETPTLLKYCFYIGNDVVNKIASHFFSNVGEVLIKCKHLNVEAYFISILQIFVEQKKSVQKKYWFNIYKDTKPTFRNSQIVHEKCMAQHCFDTNRCIRTQILLNKKYNFIINRKKYVLNLE